MPFVVVGLHVIHTYSKKKIFKSGLQETGVLLRKFPKLNSISDKNDTILCRINLMFFNFSIRTVEFHESNMKSSRISNFL